MTLRMLGFYRELPHGDPGGPSITETFVLPAETKAAVVNYLASGAVLAASQIAFRDHFTGDEIASLNLQTDGVWMWYSDLPYYVQTYDSVLPTDFLAAAAGRDEVTLSPAGLLAAEQSMFDTTS